MRELNIEPIRALERAISILNCFSFERAELSIDEIVAETKLAKATTYRLLWTLERNRVIHYDSKENKYRLGHKLLEYGGIVLENLDIRREAEPYLLDLFESVGHTVVFGIPQDETIQYLLRFDSDEGFQPRSYIGRKRKLNMGALGIVILAYRDKDYVLDFLKKYPLERHTPHTLIDQDAFIERLDKIKEQGYFIDVDETFVGFTAIAVPIFGPRAEVIGSIAIAGPSFKFEGEAREELIKKTMNTSMLISRRMGYVDER